MTDARPPDGGPPDGGSRAGAPPVRRGGPRAAAAVVLLVVGALLAPVSVVLTWARQVTADTDAYVALVAPLARDPAVQQAVVDRTTAALATALDVDGLAQGAVDQLRGLGLRPPADAVLGSLQGPLAGGMTDAIRAGVRRVVTSDRFAGLWREVNRTAHARLVAVLRDDPGSLARLGPDGTLSLDLTPVVTAAVATLRDSGFTLVDRLPPVQVTFPLVRSDVMLQVQGGWRVLQTAGWLAPLVSLLLIGSGLALARRRAGALLLAGLAVAGAAAVLLVTVRAARPWLVGHVVAVVGADAGGVLVARVSAAAVGLVWWVLAVGAVLAAVGVLLRWRSSGTASPLLRVRSGRDRG